MSVNHVKWTNVAVSWIVKNLHFMQIRGAIRQSRFYN